MNNKRIKALDVLRGLACLLVISVHVAPPSTRVAGQPDISGIAGFVYWKINFLGNSAVDLFLVLSGFFITLPLLSELSKHGTVRVAASWHKRAFRILPSYFLLMFILASTRNADFTGSEDISSVLKSLGIHLLFLQNYLAEIKNPTWTMSVIIHYYIFAPILFYTVGRISNKRVEGAAIPTLLLSIIALCITLRVARLASGHHQPDDYMFTHFRLDGLLIGSLSAYLWFTKREAVRALASHARILALLAVVLIMPSLFFARSHFITFSLGFSANAIGYSIFVLLALCHGFRGLEKRIPFLWIASVGVSSYSIYLYHPFIPALLAPMHFYDSIQVFIGAAVKPSWAGFLAQLLVYSLLSVFVGYMIVRLVERPFLKLRSKRLER